MSSDARTRRSRLAWQAVAFAAAITMAGNVMAQQKPNVLIFLVDDLGYSDLGAYGGEINTPNIDALTNNGLQFTNFYVHPRCSPTRAALLTGQQNQAIGFDVLSGDGVQLARNNVMIPEVLRRQAGYDTSLSGKWHLGNTNNFGTLGAIPGSGNVDPRVRGFDNAFTYIDSNHSENTWDPSRYRLLSNDVGQRTYTTSPGTTNYVQGRTFYQTDAITDYAMDFIDHNRSQNAADGTDNPFFSYVAYGAPHFPLQAPKALVDQYVAKYAKGWDAVRADRLQTMIDKGIIPADVLLTQRGDVPQTKGSSNGSPGSGVPTHQIPAWDSLPPDRQADLTRRMAIYAAMVDTVDQGVGRIVGDLQSHGELDNTLIMFMSDNGGDGEWSENGVRDNEPARTGTALAQMGTNADTTGQVNYGTGWANVSNTPFKEYKHYTYEGGIKSPLIVSWGAGLDDSLKGAMTDQRVQVNDVLPTLLGLLGLDMPTAWTSQDGRGYGVRPLDATSESMADFLRTGTPVGDRDMGFAHEGNRAYFSGDFKVVSANFTGTDGRFANEWELFDLGADPTEVNNLIGTNPDKYSELVNKWNQWAFRNNVIASLPAPAPAPLRADAHTLYLDHFGRAASADISASGNGMAGSLVPTTLGAGNAWVESYEGSGQTDSILVLNGSLQMATGAGMSNMFLDHNFNDGVVISDGGLVLSLSVLEINSDSSDASNRFAGFGLGMTRQEALDAGDISLAGGTSFRGSVGSGGATGVADFFIDLDLDGTLRVWDDGRVTHLFETGRGNGVIRVVFDVDSFAAGRTVGYEVFFDGLKIDALTGSFTWDRSNSNYIGLSARASNYALLDNFSVNTVPEPTSAAAVLGLAALGGVARRRRR